MASVDSQLPRGSLSRLGSVLIARQTLVPHTSITFVSKASVETGMIASYNLRKRVEIIKHCRKIRKKDMKYNDSMPKMKVDPETYVSTLCPPARCETHLCRIADRGSGWCRL